MTYTVFNNFQGEGSDMADKTLLKNTVERSSDLSYFKKHYILYLFAAPAIIVTFIFAYIPMYGAIIAFKDFSAAKGILGSDWVGLKHFVDFVTSPNFWRILNNTVTLSFLDLVIGFPVPIILALMINQIRRTAVKKNLQLVLYAPNFISVVIITGMIYIFFAPSGPINVFLSLFFDKPFSFMTNPSAFKPIYIFSGIWQGAGWASIVYIAALANVDPQLHDAATIDGASLLQRIIHIDLPTLKPVIAVLLILAVGGIMSIGFEKAYLLQTDMNIEKSEIIPTYVYKRGLQAGDYAYSTAVGLFNSVINVLLLIFANSIVKKLSSGESLY